MEGPAREGGIPPYQALLLDPSVHNERELTERMLTDAGIALDPPGDWQPPSA